MQQIDLGSNGFVSLVDHNGDVIVNPKSDEETLARKGAEKTSLLGLKQSGTTVSGQFSNATFGVKMHIKFGAFEKIMIAQLLIMLLAAIVACSLELEYANKLFNNLLEQIKIFKIDSYEHELEKQRIQLDYMKLQIKPHFFLNCLTNIYSMAQMQMFEDIQSMAISTSNYFRYSFQNGQDFVRLDDELDHVRIYLEI
ncbi:histidine kinase [Candidatus Pristimantibacillus sp. PTI5]|uniref:histidine kinase n=1 Tax=Candidatus Pristimantibacillus sp. PTI5 TaxID=3400422 RepID=UPI003B016F78